MPSVHGPQLAVCERSPPCRGGAEDGVSRALGRWVLRHFGWYAGPLYLAMILGGCAVVLAGVLAIR
ncbi:hypothetical protein GCM10010360_04630 [Streptomyces nogalater]